MSDAPHTWHRWAEPLAVALNIAYTLGYQAGEAWAFPVGGLGSALFLVICWQRQLKLEAFLWLYYIGMAVYGAWAVQSAWPDPLPTASLEAHALSIGVGLVAWWALGRFFQGKSWRPRLDAFTTVGSLVATYWMLQFVHANWLYWIVVNAVSIVLYASRGLRWGTGLFVLYTLLALEGVVQFHSAAVNASAVIRIAITGVESTGKTTLTEALGARLGGVAVRECARYDAEVIAGKATLATLERLADAQAEACEAAVQRAAATGAACVVSDTDALVLRLWGEHAFDRAPAGLERLEAWPDLTLLCAPTIPWEADPLRSMPRLEDRLALHATYAEAAAALPAHAIIDATAHEKRLDQAVRAFQNFVDNRG